MDMMGATGQATVTVRFRLETDASGVADGVHFDNVKVECVATSPMGSFGAYRVREGTSMATPQVAGVAALVLSADPGQNLPVAQLRNTLLVSVDPLASLQCKTATGGRVNAATALAITPAAASPPPGARLRGDLAAVRRHSRHPTRRRSAAGEKEAEVQEAEEEGRTEESGGGSEEVQEEKEALSVSA